MWDLKNVFLLDRFYKWWKRLWDEKIAPYEMPSETAISIGDTGRMAGTRQFVDDKRQVENGLPPIEDIAGIYWQGMRIDALDPFSSPIPLNLAKLKSFGRRRRVNPRHGWRLAMDRGRFRGVSYVG